MTEDKEDGNGYVEVGLGEDGERFEFYGGIFTIQSRLVTSDMVNFGQHETIYPLRLSVKYDGAEYVTKDDLDFTVTITEVCISGGTQPADITIDPAIITDHLPTRSTSYTLGQTAIEIGPLDATKLSTLSSCPLSIGFVTIVQKVGHSDYSSYPGLFPAITQTDYSNKKVIVESTDLSEVGEYKILIIPYFAGYYL